MRRLVGARVIFLYARAFLQIFLAVPAQPAQTKKFNSQQMQCYITNKWSFLPKTEQNHQIEEGKLANLAFP